MFNKIFKNYTIIFYNSKMIYLKEYLNVGL